MGEPNLSKREFLYLSAEEVRECTGTDLKLTMDACEHAYHLFENGECKELPVNQIVFNGTHAHRAGIKTAFVGGDINLMGIKWIPANPKNPFERNLPRAIAQIIITDPESVLPLAIMDGTLISGVRTACVGGIFAKYLALPNSKSISVLGTGPIGRLQLESILLPFPNIEEVSVYDLVPERSENFVRDMKEKFPGINLWAASSAEEAIRDTDIVSCATVTSLEDSYIEYEWLKPGSVVINSSANDTKLDTFKKADRLVFSYSKEKPGNKLRSDTQRLYDEKVIPCEKMVHISEIIAGKEKARSSDKDIIISMPMGMAITDVVNAHRVYHKALEKGVGQVLTLWEETPWL